MPTILVTGFGPYPGAPYNPTGPLVKLLARLRRPRLAEVNIIHHVFATSYAAVDRDLAELLAKYKPAALLMFGLAPRTHVLRIEMRTRNSVSLLPDAGGIALPRLTIAAGRPATLAMPAPVRRLLAAVRAEGIPATLSRDAGRYLCNYLCWRAGEAVSQIGGPHLAAFVHVPKVARTARRPSKRRKLTLDDLTRAGAALLAAVVGACHV
jgi:pyroglutamyl-peptidase